jgi:methylglutaconyl-CoA hydratase
VLSWLPRVVARKQVFWLTATGAPLTAARAAALGLLTSVAPAGELTATVDDAIDALLVHAPRVQVAIKDLLATMRDMDSGAADAFATERLITGSMQRSAADEHG